jgi:hypothetical protein
MTGHRTIKVLAALQMLVVLSAAAAPSIAQGLVILLAVLFAHDAFNIFGKIS